MSTQELTAQVTAQVTAATTAELGTFYEEACNAAVLQYDAGMDTAHIDSVVDVVLAELESRGL